MKTIIVILLFMPVFVFAQNYSGDVKVPGKDANYLFTKAREWFNENKSPDDENPVEDISKGKIKGPGRFKFMIYSSDLAVNMITYFALTVSVNDGAYSFVFENIMVERGRKFPLSSYKEGTTKEGTIQMYKIGGVNTPTKKMIETNIDFSTKVVEQCNSNLENIIASLEEKMKS